MGPWNRWWPVRQSALQLGVDDGFGAIQSALGSFNVFPRDVGAGLVCLELLQPCRDDFRQVRLLVALGDVNGFLDLAIAQRARYQRSKRAGLIAGGGERQPAINHDADGPRGHDEQGDNDRASRPAHLTPQGERVPSHRPGFLEQPHCCDS